MRLHDLRHGAASLLVKGGAHPRVAQELLRHALGSKVTMERYAHVTARQERAPADVLDRLIGEGARSVTGPVTTGADGVVGGGPESSPEDDPEREDGSGARIRTSDQAVNSRPLYH